MARTTYVQKARPSKEPRLCKICAHEVQPGEPYKYVAKKTGPYSSIKLIFCHRHHPRGSHLASGRAAELLELVESFEDAGATIDDPAGAAEALECLADDVDGLIGDLNESADNIESGFGVETEQCTTLREAASELEQWLEEFRYATEDSDEDEIEAALEAALDAPGVSFR